jgi:hypothetical protein
MPWVSATSGPRHNRELTGNRKPAAQLPINAPPTLRPLPLLIAAASVERLVRRRLYLPFFLVAVFTVFTGAVFFAGVAMVLLLKVSAAKVHGRALLKLNSSNAFILPRLTAAASPPRTTQDAPNQAPAPDRPANLLTRSLANPLPQKFPANIDFSFCLSPCSSLALRTCVRCV